MDWRRTTSASGTASSGGHEGIGDLILHHLGRLARVLSKDDDLDVGQVRDRVDRHGSYDLNSRRQDPEAAKRTKPRQRTHISTIRPIIGCPPFWRRHWCPRYSCLAHSCPAHSCLPTHVHATHVHVAHFHATHVQAHPHVEHDPAMAAARLDSESKRKVADATMVSPTESPSVTRIVESPRMPTVTGAGTMPPPLTTKARSRSPVGSTAVSGTTVPRGVWARIRTVAYIMA